MMQCDRVCKISANEVMYNDGPGTKHLRNSSKSSKVCLKMPSADSTTNRARLKQGIMTLAFDIKFERQCVLRGLDTSVASSLLFNGERAAVWRC
jgi:hypothetical protein